METTKNKSISHKKKKPMGSNYKDRGAFLIKKTMGSNYKDRGYKRKESRGEESNDFKQLLVSWLKENTMKLA